MTGFAIFTTELGPHAIAWGPSHILGSMLPGLTLEQTRNAARARGWGDEERPPPHAATAIARITALMRGEKDDLADISLDLSAADPLDIAIWTATRAIGPGRTTTYGTLATALGDRNLAQRVGLSMARNPFPPIVPCHRVLGANGKLGGFSAPGGTDAKARLLALEQHHWKDPDRLF